MVATAEDNAKGVDYFMERRAELMELLAKPSETMHCAIVHTSYRDVQLAVLARLLSLSQEPLEACGMCNI